MQTRQPDVIVRAPGREEGRSSETQYNPNQLRIAPEAPHTTPHDFGPSDRPASDPFTPAAEEVQSDDDTRDAPSACRPYAPEPSVDGQGDHDDPAAVRLASVIGPDRFAQFFSRRASLRVRADHLEVIVPTQFLASSLSKSFADALSQVARDELGTPDAAVVFTVRDNDPGTKPGPDVSDRSTAIDASITARDADPHGVEPSRRSRATPHRRYRLDRFVVGVSNKLAYEAALRIAHAPPRAPETFGTLFIHGPCGVGKTHLLLGVVDRFRSLHPHARVRYVTGEGFTNEFIGALRSGKLDDFRRRCRDLDLLCIDDVHFIANKQATQSELLHTFDAVDLGGARVVLASDEHPRQIRRFSQALVSRFMAGMVAPLDPPDAALREHLIRALAAARGLILGDQAVAALVAHTGSSIPHGGSGRTHSVRDLEGILTKVDAIHQHLPEYAAPSGRVGVLAVHRALAAPSASLEEKPLGVARPVRAPHVIAEVCAVLGVDLQDLMGNGRHARVVLARSLVAFIARRLTNLSYPELARAMGRPNHTSVLTADHRLQKLLAADESVTLTPGETPVSIASLCQHIEVGARTRAAAT